MIDDPLFRTLDECLAWAYRTRSARTKGSGVWSFIKSPRPPRKGPQMPGGLDAEAQAGMIKAAVMALPAQQRNALVAHYGQRVERRQARYDLVNWLRPMVPGTIKQWRLIHQLVRRHYGAQVWLDDLADAHKMHPNTMTGRWQAVRDNLSRAEGDAHDALVERFRSTGLVE